jgi:hypothetical protein
MFLTGRERSVRAWGQLIVGVFGYGLSVALMIASGLGLGPWDAFHVGLHNVTGMSVGVASIAAGVVLQIGTWFIGVRPGAGTLVNMVLIGVFIDVLLPVIPSAPSWLWGLAYYVPGVMLCGLSTGFYIAAGLGKGPRDGLMLGLHQRTGWPVRRVRTLIELTVLGLGVVMGGTIGVGTLLFALGIGPAAQWGLRICGALNEPPAAPLLIPADEHR